MTEVAKKLSAIRGIMAARELSAVRLRGVDWFSWATAGGSSMVILTNEIGIAEVLVTVDGAWILTNKIEIERLETEELVRAREFSTWACDWNDPVATAKFVAEKARGGRVASDRPVAGEEPLPAELVAAKRGLFPEEIERYRSLGRDAAEAMTEVLRAARPDWTEQRLAGEGARALWNRGIHPTLTLAGGESRVARHRHPLPTEAPLGARAMLVFCARRHGLYANFTRWVYFRKPTSDETRVARDVAAVESAALQASRPGASLGEVYSAIAEAYGSAGYAGEILKHHQGGTTGYLSREVVALPGGETRIEPSTAVAWNPSLPGAKIEDTILLGASGALEILTVDPSWPTFEVAGLRRPDLWVH